MISFCPHCGQTLEQAQIAGQMLTCRHCGHPLGVVPTARPAPKAVDESVALIERGTAARCPVCQQLVELRTGRALAPHFVAGGPRKVCPGSGKPITPASAVPAQPVPPRKDLNAYMTRDVIRVVLAPNAGPPTIEELTLEYLDKTDRVRLQIDALRDLLGASFQMQDYPASLNRPQLAVWSSATARVIAKKHPQGGYQNMTEAEIAQVVAEVKSN